jgi:DNA modification methylase
MSINTHPRIEYLQTSSLVPNPRNARTHSAKQITQIAASITRFGWLVPVVVDDANMIAAGHGRWEAAKELGIDMVPAIRVRFLTDADRRAFALAENRIAELSGWDDDILEAELQALFADGYDIGVTGFDLSDLDFSFDTQEVEEEPETVELPSAKAVAVSRIGDLWHIGPHRLYCGNSLEAESYDVLLGEERADMVFADPPYNVPIMGHVSGLGKTVHCSFEYASGEMSKAEFAAFLRTIFRLCVLYSRSASIHYHCMDHRHQREMLDASEGVYSEYKQLIVWAKSAAGMGTFYRSQHELIYCFKSGKGRHVNNFALGETGRYRTNVWNYAGANTFRKGRARDLEDHPTVKPTALVMDAILDCSNRGDIILDPFSGSGTTLIAAHNTGRKGAAIEIDPVYVDTALRRLKAASGLTAVHADGRSFDEVAAERLGAKEAGNA